MSVSDMNVLDVGNQETLKNARVVRLQILGSTLCPEFRIDARLSLPSMSPEEFGVTIVTFFIRSFCNL